MARVVFNKVSAIVISANHLMKEKGKGFFMEKNPSNASRSTQKMRF
jgi:hypothetical protein